MDKNKTLKEMELELSKCLVDLEIINLFGDYGAKRSRKELEHAVQCLKKQINDIKNGTEELEDKDV